MSQEDKEVILEEETRDEAKKDKEVSRISFVYNGTEYIMEFDREAIAQTEKMYDFSIGDVRSGKISAFEALFHGAFLKHHPNIKPSTVELFMKRLPNKQEVFKNLAIMYNDCISTLLEEPKEGEAISWKAE